MGGELNGAEFMGRVDELGVMAEKEALSCLELVGCGGRGVAVGGD